MQSLGSNTRILIIINPKAGPRRLGFVTSNLRRYRNEFDYIRIKDIDTFRGFIRDNLENYDIFIAAGGDGTVNSLASEIAGTGKILGVLPAGSGNGFAREMGFRKNLRWLLDNLRRRESIEVDVLRLNERKCVNVSGVGIDSIVAHGFHHLPRRGFWNYIIMAIRSVAGIKPFSVELIYEGISLKERVYMVSVANTRQFGNNAVIAPGASPVDGKITLAVVKPFPWYLFPLFAIKMQNGTLTESDYLKYIVTEGPVVLRSSENRFHIDGEPVTIEGEITITIARGELKVLKTDRNRWR